MPKGVLNAGLMKYLANKRKMKGKGLDDQADGRHTAFWDSTLKVSHESGGTGMMGYNPVFQNATLPGLGRRRRHKKISKADMHAMAGAGLLDWLNENIW